MTTVLLLHPGAMGSALGAQLVGAGHRVLWAPEGRSEASARRAEQAGLVAAPLPDGLRAADVVLCSCAPQGARAVAESAAGFAGMYVDANPLAPGTLAAVRSAVSGATFVDAAVVGPPPAAGRDTQLLLSGPRDGVGTVRTLFADTAVVVVDLGDDVGSASAAKAAYALYNKGRQALALLAIELADRHGVGAALRDLWRHPDAAVLGAADLAGSLREVAWRWGPEFEEIAATLEQAGLDPTLAHAVRGVWAELDRS